MFKLIMLATMLLLDRAAGSIKGDTEEKFNAFVNNLVRIEQVRKLRPLRRKYKSLQKTTLNLLEKELMN